MISDNNYVKCYDAFSYNTNLMRPDNNIGSGRLKRIMYNYTYYMYERPFPPGST